jgi:hypothetical protein
MPDTTPEPVPPQTPPEKPKKRRNWKRRIRWTVIVILALVVVGRVLVPLALPMVLRKVANIYGMTCDYDRLQLNVLSGDAGIWGLHFDPKEGGKPILATDYCHGNLSVLDLLRGRLAVWRVEADGVEINIERTKTGDIPLLDHFLAASGTPVPVTATPTTKPTKPGEIDLSSPLRLDALRLTHIHLHVHDEGVTPPVDADLAMDLRLSDLGAPDRRARFEMNMSVDPLLDNLKITGTGQSGGKNLDADVNMLIRGIRCKPAAAYLAPLGIVPIADSMNLTAAGKFKATAAANNAPGFAASIAFDQLSAVVDKKEAMALDHLRIDADQIDTKAVHLSRIDFDGARANGQRGADGNLQVLGIEYNPALVVHHEPTTKPIEPPAKPSPLLAELAQLPWSIGEVALRNGQIKLHDDAVTPAADVAIIADELSAKSIVHDPQNPNTAIQLLAQLHLPNLITSIKATGTVLPFADKKTFDGTVEATGIKPDAIKPYLNQIGIESTLKDARFSAALHADARLGDSLIANATVSKLEFRDDLPLLAMPTISLADAKLDTATAAIDIGDIELNGPAIKVLRDPTGQFATLGFRTRPHNAGSEVPRRAGPTAVVASTTRPTPTTQPAFALSSLPHITLHKFAWHDIHLDLEDQTTSPATGVTINEIGIEAANLTTIAGPNSAGTFKAWINAPQLVQQGQVAGGIVPQEHGITLNANMNVQGLKTIPIAPYLKPLGIEPVIDGGSFVCQANANVSVADAGPSGSLLLKQLVYSDGQSELAGVDGVLVDNAALRDGKLDIDQIVITQPRAAAWRDADGRLRAAGFKLLPVQPAAASETSNAVAPASKPAVATSQPTVPPPPPFIVSLPKFVVQNAQFRWADNAMQPPVKLTGSADVEIDNIVVGKDADPAKLSIFARATDCLQSAKITGTVGLGLTHQAIALDIQAGGLRAGALSQYFPTGMGSTLKDGLFTAHITAAHADNSAGGMAIELTAAPVDFRQAGADTAFFHLDSAEVNVPRIDLPDYGINIKEISVTGVTTHAERLASGEISCMGITVGGNEPAPVGPPATRPVVVAAPPATQPIVAQTVQPTTGPSVQDLLAASRRAIPVVTLDKLDLKVANVTLTDLARPDSKPLVISDLELKNAEPINVLGKDYASKPPIKLHFGTKISPLVDLASVDITTAPFIRQPTLVIDSSLTGIHGDGLTDLVPELKSQIDGSAMTNGTSSAHLEADAKWDRKSPLDFDISNGMDADVVVSKVQHRASPDGPILAGVDEVRAENIRFDPSQPLLRFKTIEITKPIGLVKRDKTGIAAAGWVYKIATTQPATQPTTQLADASANGKAPPPSTQPVAESAPPRAEVRIDKLLISGLDFRVEDNAVDPPLVVPLNDLDVEVRNISSLAPYEERPPTRFSVLVGADKVKLAKRGSSPVVYEDRDLFSQVAANGELSLYPKPRGWVKESVSAFELASLQGEAKALGENLTSGTYDMAVDLRLEPTGAIGVNSRFIVTDLSLTEPPNGFIQRTLQLPAPLDVAIFAVQGADNSIVFPLNPSLPAPDPKKKYEIPYVPLGLAALDGVRQVLVTAITQSAMKAANLATGALGLGGDSQPKDLTTVITFPPGSSAMGADQSVALSPLLKQLQDDPSLTVALKGELGSGDVKLSAGRANPTREQSASIESSLRARKAQLLSLRGDTAGRARAQLVAQGVAGADPVLTQLKAIDRELAATEESLDQIGDLLKPGAEKQADRRTRAACLQLAGDRLSELKKVIAAAGIAADRVNASAAKFNPADDLDGGRIVITVVKKK